MTFEEWYSEIGTIYSNKDIAKMIWDAATEQAQAEIDKLRMQLVACGVAALSNTPESAKKQRDIHPDYDSGSWRDVCDAVDREMALRQQRDELKAKCEALLGLLDDIDTASDMFKPEINGYSKFIQRKVNEAHHYRNKQEEE